MKEQIGYMSVDAGLCWVGDPCYIMGSDASHGVGDWDAFCDSLTDKGHSEPLGEGVGFAVTTGYGDGSYPVYIEKDNGRVKSITVDFMEEGEGDEV